MEWRLQISNQINHIFDTKQNLNFYSKKKESAKEITEINGEKVIIKRI